MSGWADQAFIFLLFTQVHEVAMSIKRNPLIGAILNIIWFGLADIFVGHIATGLAKMTVPLFLVLLSAMLVSNMPAILAIVTSFLVEITYFIIIAKDGYNTVAQLDNDNP